MLSRIPLGFPEETEAAHCLLRGRTNAFVSFEEQQLHLAERPFILGIIQLRMRPTLGIVSV